MSPPSEILKVKFGEYLYLSYAYYEKAVAIGSDEYFDRLCKCLYHNFDAFEHRFKDPVHKDLLAIGSGYCLTYTDGQIKFFETKIRRFLDGN